jgi:hypothetical protein
MLSRVVFVSDSTIYDNKLQEAGAAVFERYQNRPNEIREGPKNTQVLFEVFCEYHGV